MNQMNDSILDTILQGNDIIDEAINDYYLSPGQENFIRILSSINILIRGNAQFLIPCSIDNSGDSKEFLYKTLEIDDGSVVIAAFSSQANLELGPKTEAITNYIDDLFQAVLENNIISGILLNPWSKSFLVTKEIINLLLEPEHDADNLRIEDINPVISEIDALEHPFVNAHVNNISFPTSIEELEYFMYEHGMYDVESILTDIDSNWTVPNYAKIGDIVLFFHAKTAIARITALITKVKALPENSEHDKSLLLEWLDRARCLYKQYGGKIFAIARVTGRPEYFASDGQNDDFHWKGRIYADIGNIVILNDPIDISEFNSFIKISRQSGITPLPSAEFERLREIISKKNDNLPAYFLKCGIGDFDLANINKDNFMEVTQEYRRRFLLENDFRSYYVDYLLDGMSKCDFWMECTCFTEGKPNYFVDNVFKYNGIYYLLEVKLNINSEKNLSAQLFQYLNSDYIRLTQNDSSIINDYERNFMYVIDTEAFYRFDAKTSQLNTLVLLDEVHSINDILKCL